MDILTILECIESTHGHVSLSEAMAWVANAQGDYDDEDELIEAFRNAH